LTIEEVIEKFTKEVPELNIHVVTRDEQNLYHGKAAHVIPSIKEYEATRAVLVIEAKKPEP
jgi:hypothetical protein